MTVTVNDLVLAVRRKAGDWGAALMTLDATMLSDSTTLSVTTATRSDVVDVDQYVEVELEQMYITDVSTDITVIRAQKGTTAVDHFSGDLAIVKPRFTNQAILDALVRAQRVLAGYIPLKTITSTHTIVSGTEEYALPSGAEYLDSVELETSTDGLYRYFNQYEILAQYDPPRLRIPAGSATTGSTLRITYLSPYTQFVWDAIITDIAVKYHDFLVGYALGMLIEDELGVISGQTPQANGITTTGTGLVYHQQVARNLQAAAFAHLEAVKPMTRIIHVSDQRVVRK